MSRQVLAGVVAVMALALTGCGAAASPGAAATVGDQTVSASHVNELTDGYCSAFREQFKAQGTVLPLRLLRSYVVGTLTIQAAAEQLAEENGIAEPEGYVQAVKDLEMQAAALPEAHRGDVIEVESAGAYATAVETDLGGQLLLNEGTAGADDAAKESRGREALSVWLAEHPAEVDPRYGIQITNGTFTDDETGTSYPLSPNAVAAAKQQPDQTYAATLPSSQRCG